MNILITGGTGFIGSALSRELSNSGHKVIITSRRKTPPKLKNIEIVRWDIQTPLSSEIMSGIDAVINTENTGTCVPVFSCIFIFILYFQS